jgi:hypothetical protein
MTARASPLIRKPEGSGNVEGLWDDLKEALKWKPILPLLQNLEKSQETPDKLLAIRDIAAFAIKTGLNTEPYQHRLFIVYCKFCELVQQDKQWRQILEDALK